MGQVLHQLVMPFRGDGDEPIADRPVVDRLVQLIGLSGRAQVADEVDIDLERLGPRVFLAEDAAERQDPETPELDAIGTGAIGHGRRLSSGAGACPPPRPDLDRAGRAAAR